MGSGEIGEDWKERSCKKKRLFLKLFADEMKIDIRGRTPFKYSTFRLDDQVTRGYGSWSIPPLILLDSLLLAK
jgi:hypothetical protein